MDDDAWMQIGAAAAQVVGMGVARADEGRAPSLHCEDRSAAKNELPGTRVLEPTRRNVAAPANVGTVPVRGGLQGLAARRFHLHSGADPVEEAKPPYRTAHPPTARHSGIAAGTEEKGAAPDTGEESVPSAGAQAAGRQGRAHHNEPPRGGAGAVVIRVDFALRGAHRVREHANTGVVIACLMYPLAKRPARLRR